MKSFFFCLCLITFLVSCSKNRVDTPEATIPIDSLFSDYYEFKKEINPIEATKAGFNQYNDKLANYVSDEYREDILSRYGQFLKSLDQYDSAALTPSQRISLGVMKWDCKIKMEGLTNPIVTVPSPMFDIPSFQLMPLMQVQSLHNYISQLAGGRSIQPFQTVADYDHWLSRVDAYLPFLDTCIVKMKQGIRQGVVLPRALVAKMIPQLDPFIHVPLEKNLFYAPILLMPGDFPATEKERLRNAYAGMIQDRLVPTYKALQDFIINTYLPASRTTSGIDALPHGAEVYSYLLRYHTTTNLSADQIHTLGLNEVARILGEMEKVKNVIGFKGDLKSFFNFVRNNKSQMPFSQPEQVIDNFNKIRDRIDLKLDDLFGFRPRGNFEVRRTESFREASASAEYFPGNIDGSRPGVFYVPIPDVRAYNKFADEALFLHEAVPGHYYQLTLQQENKELPEFLHPESISVFVEGWALYAESLGKELGLYEDPFQYFGMLSMEMHRAIRLVVDTGLHAKGWTREQAIQYSLDNEAESEHEIIVEVERYMATPAQAVCYKIGQLKIRELRTKAEKMLGNDFSIREFHDQVLNSGSLPLVLLEEKINAWIESKGK